VRRVKRAPVLVAAAAGIALGASPPASAAAQGWSLEARAGRLDFRLGATAAPSATSLGLALGHESAEGWFQLSTGVPLGEEDPAWGAADLGHRAAVETGRFTLGVDLAAQGFLQRYRQQIEQSQTGPLGPPLITEGHAWGHGLAAQALPLAAVELGPATLQARAGVSWYRSGLAERVATRTVGLGDLRLAVRPAPWLSVATEVRRYETELAGYTFAGVTAGIALPEVRLWGSVGDWLADSVPAMPWAVGAALPLADRLELTADAREVAFDPLYASAPRRSWGVGLRLALGPGASPRAPVPAAYVGGVATIALPATQATETPSIAGDFNGWNPEPMRKAGGRWVYTASLEPGVYEYAFVAADGTWFVPESVPGRVDDGMGGHVARLVVQEQEPAS